MDSFKKPDSFEPTSDKRFQSTIRQLEDQGLMLHMGTVDVAASVVRIWKPKQLLAVGMR